MTSDPGKTQGRAALHARCRHSVHHCHPLAVTTGGSGGADDRWIYGCRGMAGLGWRPHVGKRQRVNFEDPRHARLTQQQECAIETLSSRYSRKGLSQEVRQYIVIGDNDAFLRATLATAWL